MADCLFPKYLYVGPYGSALKKDGSKGCKTTFVKSPEEGERLASDLHLLNEDTGELGNFYKIPCGECIECRKRKAFEWSVRLQMESMLYEPDECCFLTLTYDDVNLPLLDGVPILRHSDVSSFLKRLRDRIYPHSLRFFCAGEYGERTQRPHYHLLLFGYDFFKDARFSCRAESGSMLFSNDLIDKSWKKGFADFGTVDPASTMYTASYAVKKLVSGKNDSIRVPPYIQMSRRPGIGHEYLMRHKEEIAKDEGFYLNGRFIPLNRYMLNVLLKEKAYTNMQKYDFLKESERVHQISDQLFVETHSGVDIDSMNDYKIRLAFEKMRQKHEAQLRAKGSIC